LKTCPLISSYTHNGDDTLQSFSDLPQEENMSITIILHELYTP